MSYSGRGHAVLTYWQWGKIVNTDEGQRAIRVNVLCPGNIITPVGA